MKPLHNYVRFKNMGGLKMRKHKSIGTDFEDWLEEEGILEEVEIAATKKAFVIQLQAEMKKKKDRQTVAGKDHEDELNAFLNSHLPERSNFI
jgi:hypothetical protein